MNYKINWNIAEGAFAVPDCVVDDYIKLASGKAVKVLLYTMRNKIISSEDAEIIAENLDKRMNSEDVEDALSYWEQVGVICRSDAPAAEIRHNETLHEGEKKVSQAVSIHKNIERSTKMLSSKEISERINQSEEINFLLKNSEVLLGRVLTNTDQRTLIWLHDYYSMGCDIILMIVDFCKSINKANISYIEKIAVNWIDNGIETHEQAEAEILRMQNYYSLEGQLTACLGLNRSLTSKEREFAAQWAQKGISIELIEHAYEKTVNATGKVAFSYMNKIISEWNSNNVKTISDVNKYDENYKNKSRTASPASSANNTNKSAANSSEHSYDLNLWLEHAMNNIPKVKEN